MKTKSNTQANVTTTITAPAKAYAKALQAAVAAVVSKEKATEAAQAALVEAQAQSRDAVVNLALVVGKAFTTKENANSYLATVEEINAFRRSEVLVIAFPKGNVADVDAEIARLKSSKDAAQERGEKKEDKADKATRQSVLAIARANARRDKKGKLIGKAKSAADTGKAHGGHNKLSDEKKLASILAIYFSEDRKLTAEQFITICFNEAAASGKMKTADLEKACAAMA